MTSTILRKLYNKKRELDHTVGNIREDYDPYPVNIGPVLGGKIPNEKIYYPDTPKEDNEAKNLYNAQIMQESYIDFWIPIVGLWSAFMSTSDRLYRHKILYGLYQLACVWTVLCFISWLVA